MSQDRPELSPVPPARPVQPARSRDLQGFLVRQERPALSQAQRDSQVPQELPGLPGWRVRQESLVHPLPVQLEVPSLDQQEAARQV